jgi:hypothetical protein
MVYTPLLTTVPALEPDTLTVAILYLLASLTLTAETVSTVLLVTCGAV